MHSPLIHLIYTSAATRHFNSEDLVALLEKSRANNANAGITGMLLFENGSFFQILEGPETAVDQVFRTISQDLRHGKVVTIIREPIAKRAFGEWTMGYVGATAKELDEIIGLNDFFTSGKSFEGTSPGRAKKLLDAFRQGRWRSKVSYTMPVQSNASGLMPVPTSAMLAPNISFAFQPIIAARESEVVAFEAYFCGPHNESFNEILPSISEKEWTCFDTAGRAKAIDLASRLGVQCNLHLNFMARHLEDARGAIRSTLESAERHHLEPSRLVLEIEQDRLIGEPTEIGKIIEEYRGAGLRVSIDHFGAGRAGLNLLEPLRPEMISLSGNLVQGIASNGSRQAILRGILQTCNDLGIDLIAKHIEQIDDYHWLFEEGVNFFQGNLIAKEAFEELPMPVIPHSRLL
jgi:EAL domain-containing protein (putative c-di-GMP-specific phosphodiesterase class I)